MAHFADFIIQLNFYVSIYLVISLIIGIFLREGSFVRSAINSFRVIFFSLTACLVILIVLFFQKDLSILSVSLHTSYDLPVPYSIGAVWSTEGGQFLILCWLISLFTLLKIENDKANNIKPTPETLFVIACIQGFYNALLFLAANPFVQSPFTPYDGNGLLPALQDPWLFIHPLFIFLSYALMVIPFSSCIGHIVSKKGYINRVETLKAPVLLSWLFLLIGNASGAAWAYVADGFNGVWQWDIVEIGSLLPLLCLTGLIHSILIEEKRRLLKTWNTLLIILSFVFISLSICISHSRIFITVHRFNEQGAGKFLSWFCIGIILFSIFVLTREKKDQSITARLDSLFSRESGFLFNNLIIISMTFSILLGISFPYISKSITGNLIAVKQPYYNEIIFPLLSVLIAHTGVCLMLAWKKTTLMTLKKTALFPILITFCLGISFYFIFDYSFDKVYLSHVLSSLVVIMAVMEIWKEVKAGTYTLTKRTPLAIGSVIIKRSRKYFGHITHIGMALMFIGISGGFNSFTKTVSLDKGESFSFREYTFINGGTEPREAYKGRFTVNSLLSIEKGGKPIGSLSPQKGFFNNTKKPLSEKAVMSTWGLDIVVRLDSYVESEQSVFTISFNPYMKWMWAGIWIMAISTFLHIIAILRHARRRSA